MEVDKGEAYCIINLMVSTSYRASDVGRLMACFAT
jgi:hypothetical protein